MMKKMLCVLLVLLLCPVLTLAEESAAGMLTSQELVDWANRYIERAWTSEPLNNPAESSSPDGYEYIFDFATLYADTPSMSADTTVNAIVITSDAEAGPRHVSIGNPLSTVLSAYYTENPELLGSRESAVLYAMDMLPESAAWGQLLRDGQRVQTVQYAAHEQLAAGGEGYTDVGVIYTMSENRVAAIRVYGLNSRITREEASSVLYGVMTAALEDGYAQVPFSYDGASLNKFIEADLSFSGLDFLTMTPDSAINALGEPMTDLWVENGEDGYFRVQDFASCKLTWLFNKARTEGSIYMLNITADGLEGPRAVRVGDSFSSVYNRFRNGEGEYQENGTEMLYGTLGEGSFGQAVYGDDASATVRYSLVAENGRKVTLQLNFTVMELAEILLYAD